MMEIVSSQSGDIILEPRNRNSIGLKESMKETELRDSLKIPLQEEDRPSQSANKADTLEYSPNTFCEKNNPGINSHSSRNHSSFKPKDKKEKMVKIMVKDGNQNQQHQSISSSHNKPATPQTTGNKVLLVPA